MVSNWLKAAVMAASSGVAFAACSGDLPGSAHASQLAAAAGPAVAAPTASALPDFASLVEQYGPAVVNVTVVGKPQRVSGVPGIPVVPPGIAPPNDPFGEFFRRFSQPMPRGQVPPPRGEGSGFIVSEDGYILTNAHVVADAEEVTVKTTDRREYSAKVVGMDENTDVAVLKIEAKNLPTVKIGDPSKLRPGEWVIAIGSPFGFENSVTAGIVSATARAMPTDTNYAPRFIQTDVAVNPGNSGGPLFNMRGEVVGINSQIYSRTGGYMGLSFAVPIDVANDVKEQIIKHGRVTRSRIGVSIQDVNAQLAESFGLDRPRGALISMVEEGAPGEKGGLKAGDVILSVDGVEIDTSSQVPGLIASKKPGSNVQIEIWRDGKKQRVTVKPEQLRDDGERVASADGGADKASQLGLVVRPLSREEKEQAKTQGTLIVESVDGPSAAAGVRPGDIILGVNGSPVKSAEELKSAAKKRGGKVVALLIQRGNGQIFFPVRTE
jgi:serine protease Do